MAADLTWMRERHNQLVEQGLAWQPPTLESANKPICEIDGKKMIMLSANNYLNLTTHPKVVQATIDATKNTGQGQVRLGQSPAPLIFIWKPRKPQQSSREWKPH